MNNKICGNYILVLHAHIPYVLHHDRLNEEWLYEATAETYIPLLNILNRLSREGISPQLTINISPVLAEQLIRPYFVKGFKDYCEQKTYLAKEDETYFLKNESTIKILAAKWREFYTQIQEDFFEKYKGDIINAFRSLQDEGHIEIITCGATHAYLPALSEEASVKAQIKMAKQSYERLFGRSPKGFWLPECGYRPACHWVHPLTCRKHQPGYERRGLEEWLGENGLDYFIIDQEQFKKSSPSEMDKTPWLTYYLYNTRMQSNPTTIFVRDTALSEQIWNFDRGYPGHGQYLDFHKKHWQSGHRYWKITDKKLDMAYKEIYHPATAKDLIIQHAGHYKWSIKRTLQNQFLKTGQTSLKVVAFDAELFGHWWFEGPDWLYELLKWLHGDHEIHMLTCSTYREKYPSSQSIHLPESSWGKNADSSTWINPNLTWVWERIYLADKEMCRMAYHFRHQQDPLLQRILRQCVRELLILQASDWEFMITTNSTKDHAEKRIVEHHEDFKKLAQLAFKWEHTQNLLNEELSFLKECEEREEIFFDPDPHWYLQ